MTQGTSSAAPFPRKRLISWFKKQGRNLPWRIHRTPYTSWVSEIMLQQTQVKQVESYYLRFMIQFPDIQTLARAPLENVLKSWEGMGYYSRARYLHQTARIIIDRFAGEIPSSFEELIGLPGIGRSTAGAILSLGYDKSFPILDGNIRRVLIRFFYLSQTPLNGSLEKTLWSYSSRLLPGKKAGEFNEALMELGALICLPKHPKCDQCPVHQDCRGYLSGHPGGLPLKAPKKQIPHFEVSAAVIRKGRKMLITQRPEKGLLGGLWEFPGGKREPGETLEECLKREIKEELDIEIIVGECFIKVPHAYSHFRITLHCFFCRKSKGRLKALGVKDFRWVTPEELTLFPFPRADQKVIETLTSSR